MDKKFTSAVAFVHPGDCTKIEITSEESDRVFKSPPREDCIPVKRWKIFRAIHEERIRQDEKWGEQNHPMLFNYPMEEDVRQALLDIREANQETKNLSWLSIFMEEFCEAFAETEPEKQREEMVQVAAVVVQIIEYLDRRIEE
jgi:hypothetical protein